MLSICHAQQDAASHQPWKDIELLSCTKAPTDRAAPRGFYLDLRSLDFRGPLTEQSFW
jgi:hypothetical protein